MYKTIILLTGEGEFTPDEMKRFKKGDLIWGNDTCPKALKRWSVDQEEAKAELSKYECSYYTDIHLTYIVEYALAYFSCDENGEFVEGADFELAKTKEED